MRITRRVGPRGIAIVLCCLALVGTYVARQRRIGPPKSLGGSFPSVEISVKIWPGPLSVARITSQDPEKIAALVAVLRRARRNEDHNCGNDGSLLLQRSDGKTIRLDILIGHHRQYYEYRAYEGDAFQGIYRVDRQAFVRALRAFGIYPPLEQ